ncbi:MAG: hypothetical protein U0325_36460 [Polyangiales bacterium]
MAEGELLHNERYTRLWNVVIAAALAVQVARGVFRHRPPAGHRRVRGAAAGAAARESLHRARNYQQVTLLALLQLIAATVLGGGPPTRCASWAS